MKVCEKCGAVCPDEMTYCTSCGSSLGDSQVPANTNPAVPYQNTPPMYQQPYQPYQAQQPYQPQQPYQA